MKSDCSRIFGLWCGALRAMMKSAHGLPIVTTGRHLKVVRLSAKNISQFLLIGLIVSCGVPYNYLDVDGIHVCITDEFAQRHGNSRSREPK